MKPATPPAAAAARPGPAAVPARSANPALTASSAAVPGSSSLTGPAAQSSSDFIAASPRLRKPSASLSPPAAARLAQQQQQSPSRRPSRPAESRSNSGSIKDLIKAFDNQTPQSQPPRQPPVVIPASSSSSPASSPVVSSSHIPRAKSPAAPKKPPRQVSNTNPAQKLPPNAPGSTSIDRPLSVKEKIAQFNSRIDMEASAADSLAIIVGRKAKRIAIQINSVVVRRVFPSLACVVALHIVSPKLSSKLWSLIFLVIRRKPSLSKQVESSRWAFYNGLLVPIIILALIVYIVSKQPDNKPASNNAPKSVLVDSVNEKRQASSNEEYGLQEISMSPPVKPSSLLVEDSQLPVAIQKSSAIIDSRPTAKLLPTPPKPQAAAAENVPSKPVTASPLLRSRKPLPNPGNINTSPSPAVNSQYGSVNPASNRVLPLEENDLSLSVQAWLQTGFMEFDSGSTLTDSLKPMLDQLDAARTPDDESPTTPKAHPDEQAAANFDKTLNSILYDHATTTIDTRQPSDSWENEIMNIPMPRSKNSVQQFPSPPKKQSLQLQNIPTLNTMLFTNPDAKSLAYIIMNLSALPTQFPVHHNLTRLHLTGNNLSELPYSTMALLPSLTFLDICDNRISTLTKSLLHCKRLKELYARNCGLVAIEEGVLEGLEMLEIIDLSGNSLSQFSKFAFAFAQRLRILCLSNNRLRTLPASLGLHRGRELGFLMISGNQFDQSIKVFTDPIIAASQAINARVSKDLNQKQSVVPDDVYSSNSFGIGSKSSAIDDKSLFEWEDDDMRSIHDAEFDSYLNVSPSGLGYSPTPHDFNKLRRRSSLPDASRFMDSSKKPLTRRITPSRRANEGSPWESNESNSAASYHSSTNPSYVYIQRLLSYLHDVFDLSHSYQIKNAAGVLMVHSRPSSKTENYSTQSTTNGSSTVSTTPDSISQDDPDAPGLTEDERERIRKRQSPTRRAHIVAEILSTERTYVNELKTLMSLYVEPFERGILTSADMNALFSNLKSILAFHKSQLLPRLEGVSQLSSQPFGAVFLEAVHHLRMYSEYYNNFDTANEMVAHLEQLANAGNGQLQAPIRSTSLTSTSISSSVSNRKMLAKKFKNLVKIAKSSPSHTQISLQSYLIMPVQRLPRYKLLLEQLLEATPIRHEDRISLGKAVEAIRACVADLNDKKREMEEIERGNKQMSRIRPPAKGKSAVDMRRLQSAGGSRQFVSETNFRVLKYVERLTVGPDAFDGQFALTSNRDRVVRTALGTIVETRFVANASSSPSPPVAVVGQSNLGAGRDALSVYGVQTLSGCEYRFLLFSDKLCWCKPITPSPSSSILSASVGSSSSAGSGIEDLELIRAIEIGTNTKVESMVILASNDTFPGVAGTGFLRFAERTNSDGIRAFASAQSLYPASLSGSLSNRSLSSAITVTNSRGSTATPSPSRVEREPEGVVRLSDGDCVLYLRGALVNIEAFVETVKGLGCVAEDN
ncbi:hypothetical protein HDU83_003975 [Entophlyctis luteolus]|nr:hypothetical protein HDU83_003975 [Entophlyctis luteolus]